MNKIWLLIFTGLCYFSSVFEAIATTVPLTFWKTQTHPNIFLSGCDFPVIGFILGRCPKAHSVFSLALPSYSSFLFK